MRIGTVDGKPVIFDRMSGAVIIRYTNITIAGVNTKEAAIKACEKNLKRFKKI